MMFAVDCNGQRSTAEPGWTGYCPLCGGDVIAKCGRVNVWHWAHKELDEECDSWSEPITQWHIDWQYRFPPGTQEATLGAHRADVQLPSGLIIEFQHSSLSIDEIEEREQFYGPRLIWVFDAVDAAWEDRLELRPKKGRYCTFRWRHPRRTIRGVSAPTYLDVGENQLLQLEFMGEKAPYGGWGYLCTADEFVQRAIDYAPKGETAS